ncbi:xylose isomerase [Rubrobacter xylanophilus]|uniref:Xylose isomerase n=1 Tax=Rubrobacter xylanophilus TaxID=49319 RepID=A0A510HIL6_9ACTN|nr:sugar phosphate isomerase/epimerase family protein [Rubrobacter xylanophilus]BBL79830.1 xylose isomerase [Rubrobacter xylanophilus]
MVFGSVGTNLNGGGISGEGLLEALRRIAAAGADFAEIGPHELGAMLGGRLVPERMRALEETLPETGIRYTVHAPHTINLMDPDDPGVHRAMLRASIEFAGRLGASVVVCHAGRREPHHTRWRPAERLAREVEALREAGKLAEESGVTIAVENSYPEPPVVAGRASAPAARPSVLAERIAGVDHPAVRACLDVGHAAVSATLFGYDLLEECALIGPLTAHLHLHDNLGRPEPRAGMSLAERLASGFGDLHLPPGRGTIPLRNLISTAGFPEGISCCVELAPGFEEAVPEALSAARRLGAGTVAAKT